MSLKSQEQRSIVWFIVLISNPWSQLTLNRALTCTRDRDGRYPAMLGTLQVFGRLLWSKKVQENFLSSYCHRSSPVRSGDLPGELRSGWVKVCSANIDDFLRFWIRAVRYAAMKSTATTPTSATTTSVSPHSSNASPARPRLSSSSLRVRRSASPFPADFGVDPGEVFVDGSMLHIWPAGHSPSCKLDRWSNLTSPCVGSPEQWARATVVASRQQNRNIELILPSWLVWLSDWIRSGIPGSWRNREEAVLKADIALSREFKAFGHNPPGSPGKTVLHWMLCELPEEPGVHSYHFCKRLQFEDWPCSCLCGCPRPHSRRGPTCHGPSWLIAGAAGTINNDGHHFLCSISLCVCSNHRSLVHVKACTTSAERDPLPAKCSPSRVSFTLGNITADSVNVYASS